MHLAEVVGENEQGERVAVVLNCLGISQRQPRKPLVEVPDAQISPFNMACANPVPARCASFDHNPHADKWGRAITPLGFNLAKGGGKLFYHNGIVQPL